MLFTHRFLLSSIRVPLLLLPLSIALMTLTACSPQEEPPEDGPLALFGEDFRFGTATSQFQMCGTRSVTGEGEVQSNWSAWLGQEKALVAQQNPRGNGFCEQYEDDFAKAKSLGLDSFRVSLDWARAAPTPEGFDEDELDHFDAVLDSMVENDLEPILTLWHWVMPLYIQNTDAELGEGVVDLMVQDPDLAVEYWTEFVTEVVDRVKDRVDVYVTLNEPFSMISGGYLVGEFPPGRILAVDDGTTFAITLMRMHAAAFDIIKERDDVDADGDGVSSVVGITQTASAFYPVNPEDADEVFGVENLSYLSNELFLNALTSGELDVNLDGDTTDLDTEPPEGVHPEFADRLEFVGLNYYGPIRVKDDGFVSQIHPLYGLPLYDTLEYDESLPHGGQGREIYAAGLKKVLDIYAAYDLPMWITENGTPTNQRLLDEETLESEDDETQAAMFVMEHLVETGQALEKGYDIRGYFHWSLTDNFEWTEGRRQHFGAYKVDFDDADFPRTKTLVADVLSEVISARSIDDALFEKYMLEAYPTDARENTGLTLSDDIEGFQSAPRIIE